MKSGNVSPKSSVLNIKSPVSQSMRAPNPKQPPQFLFKVNSKKLSNLNNPLLRQQESMMKLLVAKAKQAAAEENDYKQYTQGLSPNHSRAAIVGDNDEVPMSPDLEQSRENLPPADTATDYEEARQSGSGNGRKVSAGGLVNRQHYVSSEEFKGGHHFLSRKHMPIVHQDSLSGAKVSESLAPVMNRLQLHGGSLRQ